MNARALARTFALLRYRTGTTGVLVRFARLNRQQNRQQTYFPQKEKTSKRVNAYGAMIWS